MIASGGTAWIGIVGGIIGILVGGGGVVATMLLLGRQKALESSLGLFSLANDELRTQVERGRSERVDMQSDFERKMADERAECARVTGHLQGQLTALTASLGSDIADSVLRALRGLSVQVEGARASLTERVDKVGAQVDTANGSTLGQLADQAEGRRVQADIPPGQRTAAEEGYAHSEEDRR